MSAISELLERVEKATGADREIDAALYNLLHTDNFRPVAFSAFAQDDPAYGPDYFDLSRYHDGWLVGKTKRDVYAEDLERYTASLDAALALVEAKLPDHGWFIRRDDTDASGKRAAPVYNAALLYPDALRVCASSAHARPTPALALLAALLRALEEKKP